MSASEHAARLLLVASAALHLGFGAAIAVDPMPWMANLSIEATSAAGWAELRAFYGGLLFSLGALFAHSALARVRLRSGLRWLTGTYLGAALVRGSWLAIDRVTDPLLLELLALEAAFALLGGLCLFALRRGASD